LLGSKAIGIEEVALGSLIRQAIPDLFEPDGEVK